MPQVLEPIKIDTTADHERQPTIIEGQGQGQKRRKQLKRKRVDPPTPEEKHAKILIFRDEINSLVRFSKKLLTENRGLLLETLEKVGNTSPSFNALIACLMEDSDLPLSKLVDDVFEKLIKGTTGNRVAVPVVSKATVKSTVLLIGQRLSYGVTCADADVLEDDAQSALWCWETRDLKLMPKSARGSLKVHRTCRKKIQERIIAVLAMINALEKSENQESCLHELTKASEKLSKVLNEADIRLLKEKMSDKSGAEMAEKEAKRGEKLLIKQMEKSKREKEKARKKVDRELQKEKLQSEKELKRLHEEAQEEERRREREENDMQKQVKKQQEEAERDKKRKEKEEAELKKQLALQKQASLMNRFLKRNKNSPSDTSMNKATTSGSSVTLAMDSVLGQNGGVEVQDIWKSHLNAWRSNGLLIHSKRKMHWGVRQKPKTELVKELKLTSNKELAYDDEELNIDNRDGIMSQTNTDNSPVNCGKKQIRAKQLLQFDKSNRPAFYGIWPKKSQDVGARHPLVKDPDIDYEIDSDEEWEEDEPGESLSECDKDEEDESLEGQLKEDDEDESEDGFFVPDGYLSENEGMNADETESDDLVEVVRNQPNSEKQVQSEEFCTLLRKQKYLNNLTVHALKKNQPLIILNLMHEKTTLLSAEELSGTEKLERMCLQALSICPMPGFPEIGISTHNDVANEDLEASSNKSCTKPVSTATAILDLELPHIISIIQSCQNIGKITKSLHDKFPAVPKSQLRNKVHEVSEFLDNRWQVKKEILSKHGLSISPGIE